MVRNTFFFSFVFILGILTLGCGGPSGPDQTLVAPADWTVNDHPAGDLHFSRWKLSHSEGSKMELTSFVAPGASEEVLKKMDVWKDYIEESVQHEPFVSRSWKVGKFNVVRYFAFANPNLRDRGTVNLWFINPNREFAITISNSNMTREPLTALADKAAEDIGMANQEGLK